MYVRVDGFRSSIPVSSCAQNRAPDDVANTYLILAALKVAADYGLQNPREALKVAEDSSEDAHGNSQKRFKALSCSCDEAAANLEVDRRFYEADDVFPTILVDKMIEKLKAYDDRELWKELDGKPHEVDAILRQYLHYG